MSQIVTISYWYTDSSMIISGFSGHKQKMLKEQAKQNSHTYIDLYIANYKSQIVVKECCRDHNLSCKKKKVKK